MGGDRVEQPNLRASSGLPPLAGTFESDARKLLFGKRASPPEGPGSDPTWCFVCALRVFDWSVPDLTRGSTGSLYSIPHVTHGYFSLRSDPTALPQPPFGPDGFLKRLRRHSKPMPSYGYHSNPMTPRHETHAGTQKGGQLRAKELRPGNSQTPRSQSTHIE